MNKQTALTKEDCTRLAALYKKRSTFKKESRDAYEVARSNGWLDVCCSHMVAKPSKRQPSKWTKESCVALAQKYETRLSFQTGESGAYQAARVNGWLDECCAHMVRPVASRNWNKDRCVALARQYESRSSFQNGSGGAYEAARINGWLDECCSHMQKSPRWTKDSCISEARLYQTRSDFHSGSGSAYNAARFNGWLDECCAHMSSTKWSKERCMLVAREYTTRSAFQKGASRAYENARLNGWLDECCTHMTAKVQVEWSKEKCVAAAQIYDSRWGFCVGVPGAYQMARVNGWLDECCVHMQVQILWSKEMCLVEALEHQTRSSFLKLASRAYHAAQRNNWLDECCRHMERANKWTKSACINEARKYGTVSAFRSAVRRAYDSAKKYGWLDECCGHMRTAETNIVGGGGSYASNQPRKKWTKEKCIEAARSFTTRSDFQNNCGSAYNAAYKHGWLTECCAHMSSPVKVSELTKEECLAAAKQYKYRSEFAGQDQSLYAKARKNGWLDECCAHMTKKPRSDNRKWSLQAVIEAAKSAGTKRAFMLKYSDAYHAAQKNKWLNECNQFLTS